MSEINRKIGSWKIVAWVLALVTVIVAAAFSVDSHADYEVYVDLGQTVNKSHLTTGGVGVRFNDRWDYQIRSMGEGETDLGYQEQEFYYSVSRIFNPDWKYFGVEIKPGIGVSYSPNLQLVGPYNYNLRLIFRYKIIEFEIYHGSSAGTFDPNRGVDAPIGRLFL